MPRGAQPSARPLRTTVPAAPNPPAHVGDTSTRPDAPSSHAETEKLATESDASATQRAERLNVPYPEIPTADPPQSRMPPTKSKLFIVAVVICVAVVAALAVGVWQSNESSDVTAAAANPADYIPETLNDAPVVPMPEIVAGVEQGVLRVPLTSDADDVASGVVQDSDSQPSIVMIAAGGVDADAAIDTILDAGTTGDAESVRIVNTEASLAPIEFAGEDVTFWTGVAAPRDDIVLVTISVNAGSANAGKEQARQALEAMLDAPRP